VHLLAYYIYYIIQHAVQSVHILPFSTLYSLFSSYHSARCTVCSHLTIQHAVQSVHILPFSTLYSLFTSYHSARSTVCSHLTIQHAVQSVHILPFSTLYSLFTCYCAHSLIILSPSSSCVCRSSLPPQPLFTHQSSNPFHPGQFRPSPFSSSWWAPFHNFFWYTAYFVSKWNWLFS
jgi:hypothetical protein